MCISQYLISYTVNVYVSLTYLGLRIEINIDIIINNNFFFFFFFSLLIIY